MRHLDYPGHEELLEILRAEYGKEGSDNEIKSFGLFILVELLCDSNECGTQGNIEPDIYAISPSLRAYRSG